MPASDRKQVATEEIPAILSLLDRLPVQGEMMIKMSETTPLTKLTLTCDDSSYQIVFYGDKLKTPDTSFYSSGKPEESELLKLLRP